MARSYFCASNKVYIKEACRVHFRSTSTAFLGHKYLVVGRAPGPPKLCPVQPFKTKLLAAQDPQKMQKVPGGRAPRAPFVRAVVLHRSETVQRSAGRRDRRSDT